MDHSTTTCSTNIDTDSGSTAAYAGGQEKIREMLSLTIFCTQDISWSTLVLCRSFRSLAGYIMKQTAFTWLRGIFSRTWCGACWRRGKSLERKVGLSLFPLGDLNRGGNRVRGTMRGKQTCACPPGNWSDPSLKLWRDERCHLVMREVGALLHINQKWRE